MNDHERLQQVRRLQAIRKEISLMIEQMAGVTGTLKQLKFSEIQAIIEMVDHAAVTLCDAHDKTEFVLRIHSNGSEGDDEKNGRH